MRSATSTAATHHGRGGEREQRADVLQAREPELEIARDLREHQVDDRHVDDDQRDAERQHQQPERVTAAER
jgi:hypothetical protein